MKLTKKEEDNRLTVMQFPSRDVIEIDLRSVIFKNVSCHGSTSEYEMKDVLRFLVVEWHLGVSESVHILMGSNREMAVHTQCRRHYSQKGNIAHFSVNLFCSRQK